MVRQPPPSHTQLFSHHFFPPPSLALFLARALSLPLSRSVSMSLPLSLCVFLVASDASAPSSRFPGPEALLVPRSTTCILTHRQTHLDGPYGDERSRHPERGCQRAKIARVRSESPVPLVTESARFRVSGFWFRVSGLGSRVSGLGFRVSGFGFRVSGSGFLVSDLRFRVSSFRVRGTSNDGGGLDLVQDFRIWV